MNRLFRTGFHKDLERSPAYCMLFNRSILRLEATIHVSGNIFAPRYRGKSKYKMGGVVMELHSDYKAEISGLDPGKGNRCHEIYVCECLTGGNHNHGIE